MTTRLAPWTGPLSYDIDEVSVSNEFYPTSIGMEYDSTWEVLSGVTVDQSQNGRVRSRSFHSKNTYRFTVLHRYITSTEAETLRAYYDTTKTQTVKLVWKDGRTYDCVWGPKGLIVDRHRGSRWMVTSELIGQIAS